MIIFGALLFFSIVFIAFCNILLIQTTRDRIYNELAAVPFNTTAIVLGTSQYLRSGRENLYFKYRINAAAELYTAGKCKFIIVSGDNSQVSYNEPQQMKEALLARGIPDKAIYLDYAGFRTLDSIVRSKKIFGQNNITIISQEFHNQRALFIADHNQMNAVAFNAQEVHGPSNLRIKTRELFAKTMAFLDIFILKRKPKFLGDPIEIRADWP